MNYILYFSKRIVGYANVDAPSNGYLWLQVNWNKLTIITVWVMM